METETFAQHELKEYLMRDPEYIRLAELQIKVIRYHVEYLMSC